MANEAPVAALLIAEPKPATAPMPAPILRPVCLVSTRLESQRGHSWNNDILISLEN